MGTYGSGTVARFTTSLAIGGFLCLGIILLLIVSTIILSLIPIYTPNHGEVGYGEHYRIKSFLIKVLYQNSAFTFNNGRVDDSMALSTLCGSVYHHQGTKNFAGCIAKDFYAFGPYNQSQLARRRRRAIDAGLYEIGEINLYYSTSCPNKGDTNQYANSTTLTNCIKSRLTACNNLVDSSSKTLIAWTQFPHSFPQTIASASDNKSQTIIAEQIFGSPFSLATSLGQSLNLSNDTRQNFQAGCQYIGALSQEAIADALASQATMTSTQEMIISTPSG